MRPLVPAVLVFGLLVIPVFIDAAKIDVGKEKCIGYPAYPGEVRPCPATVPNGTVPGTCISNMICKGEAKGDGGGFQDIMKQAMGLLEKMMQKKEKPPQPPPPPPPPQQQAGLNPQGCVQTYQVTAPSGDPCAYYVPPASASLLSTGAGQSTASNELLNALSGGGGAVSTADASFDSAFGGTPSIAEQILGQADPSGTGAQSVQGTRATSSSATQISGGLGGQAVNLRSGAEGDIEVRSTGATVIARARDREANTEVAGFYGSDTFSGQPQSAVAKLCQSRPWGKAIVSFVIPPSFFDSLCAWRGYQVGTPPPPTPPTQQQAKPAQPATSSVETSPPPGPVVEPEVDIWAVPEKVPLGARTSIFWNTKGVESCTVGSPDGSFNEKTLSGGAATVPLSGATTFTISCLTRDGKPITDYVTVNLAI